MAAFTLFYFTRVDRFKAFDIYCVMRPNELLTVAVCRIWYGQKGVTTPTRSCDY